MTLKKWFYLSWTSFAFGIAATLILGLIMFFTNPNYQNPELGEIGFNFISLAIAGATTSVLSQMGFFGYLILKWIAISVFRSKVIWDYLQFILSIVAVGDLLYLRYVNYGVGSGIGNYIVLPAFILVAALAVSFYKMKLTNRNAFVPTFFVMTAVTILEAVPVFRENNIDSLIVVLIPLMICNAWQLLILHKVIGNK